MSNANLKCSNCQCDETSCSYPNCVEGQKEIASENLRDAQFAVAVIVDAWKLLAEWRPIGWIDHACAECIPNGPMVINGSQCTYHKVKRMANSAIAKLENCQDPQCVFFGWHEMMHPGGRVCPLPAKSQEESK